MKSSRTTTVFRFGTFEADVLSRELRKHGVQVKIQEQPFQVLALLLQRPGEVVTREELRSHIWHSDTFVDFDNGVNTSINRLRETLKDSVSSPRFIETVPKRGYRFIAPVTTNDGAAAPTAERTSGRNLKIYATAMAATMAVFGVLSASGLLWRWWQRPRLTERDTIVLADFTNSTGDPVFDSTLRQGLAVQLEQSPVLGIVSEDRVQQTLQLMKQPADTRLTPEIAREICQRTNSTIAISGSIAQIGGQYELILRAVNCSSGDSLTSTQIQANDKNHVLDALGKASTDIRKKLGESLATLQKFDTPPVQATTYSLKALQLYSLGYKEQTGKGDSGSARPFLQEAIRLDPNFAMAYVLLGDGYWNVGENVLASENIRKAFERRAGVSEWERLRIEAEYHSLVTCNLIKARGALEVWAQTYPKDWAPRNRLGVVYNVLGQFDRGLAAGREAQALYPESALVRGNIIASYIALNRLREAHAVVDETQARNPDSPQLRINLYRLAFLEDDREAMERQVALASGKLGTEDELLRNKADTAAYFGQLARARTIYSAAIASAERAGEKEAAASFEVNAALTAALFGFGQEARRRVKSVLRLPNGPDTQYQASLALAFAGGNPALSQRLAADLDAHSPEDTIVKFLYVPTMKAQLALLRNDAPKAIETLQAATPFELAAALYPVYVRGLAYLAANRGGDAAVEFQRILSHRGVVLNAPISALANLQLGRALVLQGDIAKASAAYRDFLVLWKDADPDIPILKQAKAEYANMQEILDRNKARSAKEESSTIWGGAL